MQGELKASLSAIAAAVMLAACASKEPVTTSTAVSAQDETASEYQRLAENATQQRTCKRQTLLGTRVPTVVCYTQEELKAQQERSDEAMRDIQANSPDRQGTTNLPPPPPPSSPK
jgi:hypothetical protein